MCKFPLLYSIGDIQLIIMFPNLSSEDNVFFILFYEDHNVKILWLTNYVPNRNCPLSGTNMYAIDLPR